MSKLYTSKQFHNLILLIALMCSLLFGISELFGTNKNSNKQIIVLTISGPIGPATSDYILYGLEEAKNNSAVLVVLNIDTPGGLDVAMRDIIQGIISSPVPVATYVSPSGARAASAGTYILYASHIAAMAPATTLGAATPIEIGGMPELPNPPQSPDRKTDEDNVKGNESSETDTSSTTGMQQKMVNDAAAYIRGLAQLRGRNVEWAEEAVREASSLSAEEAIDLNVIDLIADDITDLLEQVNERNINVKGFEHILTTKTAALNELEPDWRNKLLSVITDPNILPVLMTLGMFGLIYEMLNPGFVLPGVLGGICILLALYAAQVLPINYAGLALILLGVLFMIGEAFAPSFGALGIGGAIAFAIGSIILIDTSYGDYGISIPFIFAFALVNALFFFAMLNMVVKARKKPIKSGSEELIGSNGEVIEAIDNYGRVRVHSENWQAKSNVPILPGQKVRVTKVDGLTLIVEPENSSAENIS